MAKGDYTCVFCRQVHPAGHHCQCEDRIDAANRKALREEQDWYEIEPPPRSWSDRFHEAELLLEEYA